MSKNTGWENISSSAPKAEGVALGTRYNEEDKVWEVIEIDFNVDRNYAKISKVLACGETKAHAIAKYNIRSFELKNNTP